MASDTKEPQSYGSGRDWVEGKTGGKIHDPKASPPPEQREFYDDARDSETSDPHQGGETSPVQLAERDQPEAGSKPETEDTVTGVTSAEGGAKRDSYFRKRDYE